MSLPASARPEVTAFFDKATNTVSYIRRGCAVHARLRHRSRCETSVTGQKAGNIHIGGQRSGEDFVAMREARDSKLSVPKLISPSLQVNMRRSDTSAGGGWQPFSQGSAEQALTSDLTPAKDTAWICAR